MSNTILTCDTPIYVLNPEKRYTHVKVEGNITWGDSYYTPRSSGWGGWDVKDFSGTYHYVLNLRFAEPARISPVDAFIDDDHWWGYKYIEQFRSRSVLAIIDDVPLSYGRMSYSYKLEDGAVFEEGAYDFNIIERFPSYSRSTSELLRVTNSDHWFWQTCHMPELARNLILTSNYDGGVFHPELVICGKLGANGVYAIYPEGDRPLDERHEDFNYMLIMKCTILEAE